jgi:hypothetical protein
MYVGKTVSLSKHFSYHLFLSFSESCLSIRRRPFLSYVRGACSTFSETQVTSSWSHATIMLTYSSWLVAFQYTLRCKFTFWDIGIVLVRRIRSLLTTSLCHRPSLPSSSPLLQHIHTLVLPQKSPRSSRLSLSGAFSR